MVIDKPSCRTTDSTVAAGQSGAHSASPEPPGAPRRNQERDHRNEMRAEGIGLRNDGPIAEIGAPPRRSSSPRKYDGSSSLMNTTGGSSARHNYVRRLEMNTLDSEEDQLFREDRGYPRQGKRGPLQQANRPAVALLQPPFQEREVQSLEREMRRQCFKEAPKGFARA
jgi:hypothetical protein